MGRVIMNGPPDIVTGRWCPACLMRAKQQQWETYQDEIQAGYAAPGDQTIVIQWPDALTAELYRGAYRAVAGDFPQLGIVDDLCWNDVAGTNPQRAPSQLLTPAGPVPPGLIRGKGN